MATEETEKLLTINQLAEAAQVTRETIRRWRKAGKIKEYVIAGHVRFKLSDIVTEAPTK